MLKDGLIQVLQRLDRDRMTVSMAELHFDMVNDCVEFFVRGWNEQDSDTAWKGDPQDERDHFHYYAEHYWSDPLASSGRGRTVARSYD